MGKQSKKRKRGLFKTKKALVAVIGLTERYYNDTRMLEICNTAKKGLTKIK